MTIPQDHRSPHDQQRWIELYNAGDDTIPAFGVCEVIESSRPEAASDMTPDGGRTMLHVVVPTTDNPCNTVVNGPCDIPPGKSGKIGTKDSPMLALVASAYPSQTIVGVEEGSCVLKSDLCGYIIDGDYDATTGTQRVTRYDNCGREEWVRAVDCHYLGQNGYGQPQRINPISGYMEDDPNKSQIEICDPLCWRMALPDEIYKVERRSCTDDCWLPATQYGLQRMIRVKTQIDCDDQGQGYVCRVTGCGWQETECVVDVCNKTNRRIVCDVEYEDIYAVAWPSIPPACQFMLLYANRPYRAKGSLTSAMCGGSGEVSSVVFPDVCSWQAPSSSLTVGNPTGRAGCQGDAVELTWNDVECGWDVIAVSVHRFDHMVTDVTDGSACVVSVTRSAAAVYIEQCNECGEEEDNSVGSVCNVDVLTGIATECSGNCGGLRLYTRTLSVCACGEIEEGNIIAFSEQDVITDIRQNGLNVEAYVTTLCTLPCYAGVGWETVLEGTDCSSGSS